MSSITAENVPATAVATENGKPEEAVTKNGEAGAKLEETTVNAKANGVSQADNGSQNGEAVAAANDLDDEEEDINDEDEVDEENEEDEEEEKTDAEENGHAQNGKNATNGKQTENGHAPAVDSVAKTRKREAEGEALVEDSPKKVRTEQEEKTETEPQSVA